MTTCIHSFNRHKRRALDGQMLYNKSINERETSLRCVAESLQYTSKICENVNLLFNKNDYFEYFA